MSRASTPSQSHQQQSGGQMQQQSGGQMQQSGSQQQVPHERIAMRAYEKWCRRGRTHGHDKQDWIEAESELRAEGQRGSSSSSSSMRR